MPLDNRKQNNILDEMNKANKKDLSPEAKKKQLLLVFQEQIPFLQIFSPQELAYLDPKMHVFVFSKGQMLAREKQPIDYLGVVVEGRAVARSRSYQIGDIIGSMTLLGYQQHHPENIPAESDGVIIALRVHDFHQIDRLALKNKILSRLLQLHCAQLLKREQTVKSQFEQVQEKKVTKYLSPEWACFFSTQIDLRDKIRFLKYFPFLRVNQKDLIVNSTSKPYLLYVVQGQLIAKTKPESKIIQAGKMYNLQGFIFDQTTLENVYCLSSEAIVLMVDRAVLSQLFKTQIFRALMKMALAALTKIHKKQQTTAEEKEGVDKVSWNLFKKYPNTEILPLPKKIDNGKTQKINNNAHSNVNLITYQSLFRDQLGNEGKAKTVQSVASSGYDKLFTMKTQTQGKQMQSALEYEKIKKEAELLSEKFKKSEQERKSIQLDLIEHKSRGAMHQVHKQIRKLYQQDEGARLKMSKTNILQKGQNLVSLKAAFEKQLKENKLQILVAKCAFKWLFITRKRKTNKKE